MINRNGGRVLSAITILSALPFYARHYEFSRFQNVLLTNTTQADKGSGCGRMHAPDTSLPNRISHPISQKIIDTFRRYNVRNRWWRAAFFGSQTNL